MSRQIWSRERIIEEIAQLHSSGCDITQSWMESIDSRLTSAAIRYFGSWRAAVEAAGIDYDRVAALGKQRRSEKITKWTNETIVEEIRRLAKSGEELTSTMIRRKHLSLYATARRKDHFGSWAGALEAAGIDYSSIKKESREKRRGITNWKEQLLLDFFHSLAASTETLVPADPIKPDAEPDWARDLIRERLVELYEGEDAFAEGQVQKLQALISAIRLINEG